MQAIAEEAAIAAGTLYLYVRSKGDLLLIVTVDDLIDLINRAAKTVPARAELLDRIFHVFDRMLGYHARKLELARHFAYAVRSPERRTEIDRLMSGIIQPIAKMIAADQAKSKVRTDVLPAMAAQDFMALYIGMLAGLTNGTLTLAECQRGLRTSFDRLYRGLHP